jgi:Platelet-activating factor acetylhydrolase, isoform II
VPYHPAETCATAVCVAAVVLSSAAAARAEPVPEPTGAYPVGRATYHLVDGSRDEDPGSHKDHRREFRVHLWYPAQAGAAGKPAPWVPADQLSHEETGFVGMMLRRSSAPSAKDVPKVLTSVAVHAREDVPPADAPRRFPVLLFAAGSQQIPSEYSCLTEDLASRGFVVVGYGPTVMGGRTWRDDLTQVLDQLGVWNTTPGHRFFGRLNLDLIGAFGHSFGASAVSIIAAYDKRLKAIVLIDGGGRPEDARAIPALILNSGGPDAAPKVPSAETAIARKVYLQWSKPGIQVTLLGAVHMSFTDMAVIKAFELPGDGSAFIATTRAVIGGFFGQYLLGEHSELTEKGSAKYPLAKVETPR